MKHLLQFFLVLVLMGQCIAAFSSTSCPKASAYTEKLGKRELSEIQSILGMRKCLQGIRSDINKDGSIDYVIFDNEVSWIIITNPGTQDISNTQKVIPLLHGESDLDKSECSNKTDSPCSPEITVVPSILQDGYDAILRTTNSCFLIRGSNGKWRHAAPHVWDVEQFDCKKFSNRDYLLAQVQCISSGGQWQAIQKRYRTPSAHCFYPISDAGKKCTSSADCQQACYFTGPTPINDEDIYGECSEYKSCAINIVGKRLVPFCVD